MSDWSTDTDYTVNASCVVKFPAIYVDLFDQAIGPFQQGGLFVFFTVSIGQHQTEIDANTDPIGLSEVTKVKTRMTDCPIRTSDVFGVSHSLWAVGF